MTEIDDSTDAVVPPQLQQYFSGIAAAPKRRERPVRVMAVEAEGAEDHEVREVAVADDSDELHRLRRLIQEKDHAIFRAALSASDLEHQLDEAKAESEALKSELAKGEFTLPEALVPDEPKQAVVLSQAAQEELNRQRKEWLRIQKSLEREHAHRKAELIKVRGQWYQTQQQLELETRARRMEAAQASAKIANLERSLSNASAQISRSYENNPAPSTGRRIAVAVASVALLVAAGAAWSRLSSSPLQPTVAKEDSAPVPSPLRGTVVAPVRTGTIILPGMLSGPGFQSSLGRLNRALSAFGNQPAEQVLRAVRSRSADHSVCAFQWNNGQPALLFGEGAKLTLAATLGNCATAVENFQR